MKHPWASSLLLLVSLFTCVSSSYATDWEFDMKVRQDGENVALPVYLYRYGDLSFPYRMGTSTAGGTGINFKCDIDEGPGWPFQEPNTPDPSWPMIIPGDYYLRVSNRSVFLRIKEYGDGIDRDFTVLCTDGDFSAPGENRIVLGESEDWTVQTADVFVDQKLSDGQQTVSEVKRFSNPLGDFESLPLPIPVTIPASQYSTQVLKGDQAIRENEKFNNWSGLADITNHHAFQLGGTPVSIISKFKHTYDGIRINTDLIDLPGSYADTIRFKDPWLADDDDGRFYDSPYGYRNLGMNAPFISEPSGVLLGTSTKYKGAFLNQDYSIPGNPYYCVGAPLTQTIAGIQSNFIRWSAHADSAVLRNPEKDTSAVVFKIAGATVTAWYKGHLY